VIHYFEHICDLAGDQDPIMHLLAIAPSTFLAIETLTPFAECGAGPIAYEVGWKLKGFGSGERTASSPSSSSMTGWCGVIGVRWPEELKDADIGENWADWGERGFEELANA
jgi:hypothetical protein